MIPIKSLIFRKLTDADFFNINKPVGTEQRGGGQSYIDISTSAVTEKNWNDFFQGQHKTIGTNGPGWTVNVHSLGPKTGPQDLTISQRRKTSFSIRSQKLSSRLQKRVYAWRPDITGFPKPPNPKERSRIYDLHIYIAKLENGEYWAGWFQSSRPEKDWSINKKLNQMFTENEGYLKFSGDVSFDVSDPFWPFRITKHETESSQQVAPATKTEEADENKILFDQDEIIPEDAPPRIKESVRRTRVRNTKSVKKLKYLYKNLCQVTGSKYTFKKRDGKYYSEAHHLIPLGDGGADSVYNIVILSPLIHRMLHYAKVEGLDLKKIKNNKLRIKINGVAYEITWHPDHAKIVHQQS